MRLLERIDKVGYIECVISYRAVIGRKSRLAVPILVLIAQLMLNALELFDSHLNFKVRARHGRATWDVGVRRSFLVSLGKRNLLEEQSQIGVEVDPETNSE